MIFRLADYRLGMVIRLNSIGLWGSPLVLKKVLSEDGREALGIWKMNFCVEKTNAKESKPLTNRWLCIFVSSSVTMVNCVSTSM